MIFGLGNVGIKIEISLFQTGKGNISGSIFFFSLIGRKGCLEFLGEYCSYSFTKIIEFSITPVKLTFSDDSLE